MLHGIAIAVNQKKKERRGREWAIHWISLRTLEQIHHQLLGSATRNKSQLLDIFFFFFCQCVAENEMSSKKVNFHSGNIDETALFGDNNKRWMRTYEWLGFFPLLFALFFPPNWSCYILLCIPSPCWCCVGLCAICLDGPVRQNIVR